MNTVVIARYSEDLQWIKLIPKDFEVFVYNKGQPISSPDVLSRADHVIERPNVGRESETYLHHMLEHVKNGDGYTVFSQAEPFSHSPDFIRLLEKWQEWAPVQPMSWQWRGDKSIPPTRLLMDFESKLYGRPRIRPQYFSLHTWGPIDFTDPGAAGMGTVYRALGGNLPDGTNLAAHFLGRCGLDELAAQAAPHSIGAFSYGAIFAARNDLIVQFPKDGLNRLNEFAKGEALVYGYILERMWLHLFGYDFVLPQIQPEPL